MDLDDAELLERMCAAKNGAAVRALYDGDTSVYDGDESRADEALCFHLAFWTAGDSARIDGLFRSSGLMRPKWDERRGTETYGAITVRRAVENVGSHFGRNGAAPPDLDEEGVPDAAPPWRAFPRTDAGNGEVFAHLYGDQVRYDHRRGRWLVWDEHLWREDDDMGVVQLAKAAARRRYKQAGGIENPDERKREAVWAIQSESRARLDAALALARTESPISDAGDRWDATPGCSPLRTV